MEGDLQCTRSIEGGAWGSPRRVLSSPSLPSVSLHEPMNLYSTWGRFPPHEPILTTFGNKRVIAFYEPDNGRCAVNAIVYDKTDADTGMTTAARVRVSLNPRQMVHLDSTDNKSINLQCGDRAETLALVDSGELVAFGIQQANPPMRASASGF